jgi:hypothetical protein
MWENWKLNADILRVGLVMDIWNKLKILGVDWKKGYILYKKNKVFFGLNSGLQFAQFYIAKKNIQF